MKVIDCKKIRNQIIENIKSESKEMKVENSLSLAVIQVGNDQSSNVYVRNKKKASEECGIKFEHFHFDEDIQFADLFNELTRITQEVDEEKEYLKYTGVMIQLPLPDHLKKDQEMLLNAIPYYQDVDGLSSASIGNLWSGSNCLVPCTAAGVMDLLPDDLSGKTVQLINRSDLIGKPLLYLLQKRNATVTLMHSKTDFSKCPLNADIIITGTGKAHFIKNSDLTDQFKNDDQEHYLIDCGITRDENGKLCGDVDWKNIDGNVNLTSTPGGTGVLTVAELMNNVLKAKKIQIEYHYCIMSDVVVKNKLGEGF